MNIRFLNCRQWGIKRGSFDVYGEKIKKSGLNADGIMNVIFVNDSYIRSLNKKYRKTDAPTDVLSFSYINAPDFDNGLIGEIYISVPTAKRQAEDCGRILAEEVAALFVHGLLHIFGFNHENDRESKIMSGMEKKILGNNTV